MLIVVAALAIVLIIGGAIIITNCVDDIIGIIAVVLGVIFFLVGIIGAIYCGSELLHSCYIDDEIAMYEAENARIEQSVADVVTAYLEHESAILTAAAPQVSPNSAITIIAAYPELNSSEIVATQLQIYYTNNKLIRELRAEKLRFSIYRWWLYFGSNDSSTEAAVS